MKVKVNNKQILLESQTGQKMEISLDEAKELCILIEDKLYMENLEDNLKKDWNYLGGL